MKRLIFITIFVIFYTEYSFNQSLQELENKYLKLDSSLVKETRILDSLKFDYDSKIKIIDAEKENKNNEKVLDLMSSSASLSNKIIEQQKKVFSIETELENNKKKLHKIYTDILDSLYNLKQSPETESKILLYTERKLLTSPKIDALSFDPEKLLQLNPGKVKNQQGKKLYQDYLKNALTEVERNLEEIDKIFNEVSNALSLQSKTKRFLEEVEFEGGIKQPRKNQVPDNADAFDVSGNSRGRQLIKDNAQGFLVILNQLNLHPVKNDFDNYKIDNNNFNLDEYYSLIKEVKKSLQDYKLVLSNKINSDK